MTNNLDTTIIIPAKNEAKNLKILIPNIYRVLNGHLDEFNVFVLNHNSEDDSDLILKELKTKYSSLKYVNINNPNIPLGSCLIHAIKSVSSHYLITMDGDLSHLAIHLHDFIDAFSAGHDVVIGGRYKNGQAAFDPKKRYLISKIFNRTIKIVYHSSFSYFTT